MNFLFLRGQIPQDRNPREIVFDRIEDCDDMWTHLAFEIGKQFKQTELWYWGGNREHQFSNSFTERWIPNFKTYNSTFKPDVIMCRGGFSEYHHVLNRHPNAIKIYYGAGRRFLPQPGFTDYDIILQDSPEQLQKSKIQFPNSLSTLYIKPAVENIFFPMNQSKEFDICFPASGRRPDKGHSFVFNTAPKNLKIYNLGYKGNILYPHNITHNRVLRTNLNKEYQKCKIGIVCSDNTIDSTPRVIPEMLACDIPIVILDTTLCWHEKYIVPGITGEIATKQTFWNVVSTVLNNVDKYHPRDYYINNISIERASSFLIDIINQKIKIKNELGV